MRRWVIVATLSLLVTGSTTQGADYVSVRIVCPSVVSVKIDWEKQIGSDPTFTESLGESGFLPSGYFQRIWQEGQVISCTYDASGILYGRHATYSYTVKRKILGCKKVGLANVPVLECRLEP